MSSSLSVLSPHHRIVKRVLRFLLGLVASIEVVGLERVPRQGAVVLYGNHANSMDVLVTAGVINRDAAIMAKQELFQVPIISQLIRWYGVFPVRRTEGDLKAYRHSLAVLKEGGLLVIFPEGHRSGTGVLQRAKPGFVTIAGRAGALIQPVAVTGVVGYMGQLLRLRRLKVRVHFGHPRVVDVRRLKAAAGNDEAIADEAMYELASLLPANLRGVYGDARSPRLEGSAQADAVLNGTTSGGNLRGD